MLTSAPIPNIIDMKDATFQSCAISRRFNQPEYGGDAEGALAILHKARACGINQRSASSESDCLAMNFIHIAGMFILSKLLHKTAGRPLRHRPLAVPQLTAPAVQ